MDFKKYVTLFGAVTLCAGFFSCDDDVDGEEPQPADTVITSDFFILNRGNQGENNASIAYYDAASVCECHEFQPFGCHGYVRETGESDRA